MPIISSSHAPNARFTPLELMRIFAIMLVLLCHAIFPHYGNAGHDVAVQSPASLFASSIVIAMSIIGANCFVLISGYFGIRPTIGKLARLLFIVYFWRVSFYILAMIWGSTDFSAAFIVKYINPFQGEWFVGAYVALFLFSPVLNMFADKTPRKLLRNFITGYIGVEVIFGWLTTSRIPDFDSGYSVFAFVGLYLIGRYISKYPDCVKRLSSAASLSLYLGLSIVSSALFVGGLSLLPESIDSDLRAWFYSYISPFTIASSVFVLIGFAKMKFSSRLINWMAASAFSVYLIQCNHFIYPRFSALAQRLLSEPFPDNWLLILGVCVAATYMGGVALDQLRKASWMAAYAIARRIKHTLRRLRSCSDC